MSSDSGKKTEKLAVRPPIVVVMGHVDHGKTALLDYIRKTNVVAREAGGITQSTGAYEITHPSTSSGQAKRITFIDTPGHEAFREMRSRGATVADLAILVAAADEGVKPQTIEAFNILKESKTPFIVAITKIDKPAANVEKVKSELLAQGIALEGYGGDISWQAVSVVTGAGINDLLDLILLVGEVLGLTYDPEARAKGVLIEVFKDSRRGVVAHVVLRDGILKEGDYIVTKTATGKIKMLETFSGERVKELSPSSPASVLGFESLPSVGEEFYAGFVDLAEIELELARGGELSREKLTGSGGLSAIEAGSHKVITKADTSGSLEVLNQVIGALEGAVIVDSSLGDVSDGDVDQALGTGSLIIGFRVKVKSTALNRARVNQVRIFTSEIIYKLVEDLEKYVSDRKEKEVSGELEVLKIFGAEKNRLVLGGRVVAGVIKNGAAVGFERRESAIGEGKIINLQENKKDVSEVGEGKECGLLVETNAKVSAHDRLKIFS